MLKIGISAFHKEPRLYYKDQSVNSVQWTGFCYVTVYVSYKHTVKCVLYAEICYVKKAFRVLTAVI